ncbi:MAG: ABC transporter ATP-binding protein [Parcubacteria group bacterium]
MTKNNGKIIEVENLRKTYGDLRAVDNVSFSVGRGEIFGLLGPNGAGKTTTLEMIEGLRKIDNGQVQVAGIDVDMKPDDVKSQIGVQLQSSSFFDYLNLKELLKLFGNLYQRKINPDELLDKVELSEKGKSYVKHLSGGQKQRFSIASALVNDPQVLFLDEPTTGLDPQARRHLWGLIEKIRDTGKTVVLTTHYMDEAEILCDRVAIIDKGKIIALDTPDKLIDNLLAKGFKKEQAEKLANLEDVFLDLTGRNLREK